MQDVLVLTYHAVSPDWPAELSVFPDRMERQLRLLLDRGYRGATFTQAVLGPPAEKTLAVTFDDAYRSVIELAFPILSKLGLPGTVFAPTNYIGSEAPMAWPGIDRWLGTRHERELTPMSWEELGTLVEAGWEIGSHGRSHPFLTRLDDDALADELQTSRATCEARLSRRCESLAYPYGDADARVVAAAATAGYRAATGPRRPIGTSPPLAWPRMGVWHADEGRRFRRKVSRPIRWAWRSPAWSAIRRLGPLVDR
jgi:peptidoglycan/xylan/chitin deacetylase (PgdA/CDA1 family)